MTDGTGAPPTMEELAAQLRELTERMGALEVENAALRAAPSATPAPPEAPPGRLGRRAVMTGAAGLAAAAAATTVNASPAAAANGDPILMSTVTAGKGNTLVRVNGPDVDWGFAATDQGALPTPGPKPALLGYATGNAVSTGVHGITSSTGSGVRGDGTTGYGGYFTATQGAGDGVFAQGNRFGVIARGERAGLWVTARPTRSEPPLGGAVAAVGTDTGAELWAAVGTNAANDWRMLAGPTTAGSFHLLPSPQRAYDSRPGTSPSQGPKPSSRPATSLAPSA